MRNLCRLDDTRIEVETFDARNRDQRAVRRRLLEELEVVERRDCRPGREAAFEASWARIEQLHTQLASPELAWRPWWISRVFWEGWRWLWGAWMRVRERWWRLEEWLGRLRERIKAVWWSIEVRL